MDQLVEFRVRLGELAQPIGVRKLDLTATIGIRKLDLAPTVGVGEQDDFPEIRRGHQLPELIALGKLPEFGGRDHLVE